MTPLELKILAGDEDERLLEHIDFLERAREQSARGLSPVEERTLQHTWLRLDQITNPDRDPPSAGANLMAAMIARGIR